MQAVRDCPQFGGVRTVAELRCCCGFATCAPEGVAPSPPKEMERWNRTVAP
jgi:hypothetical protein